MEKVYGSSVRQDGLYKVGRNKWELIYGFGKDDENEDTGWNWRERFAGKPSLEKVKEVIISHIDSETDKKILSGFSWNGIKVWLSQENQMNFKAAYDLSVQAAGATLPIKLKLGEDTGGNPVYHEFTAMDEFTDFYTKAVAYIIKTLNDGWTEKDSIDISAYE